MTAIHQRANVWRLVTAPRRKLFEGDSPDVTVHVASKNTLLYTELCLRSMWRLAGRPFQLVVGDCASEDGTQEFLRRMAARGFLTLQESPADTSHSDWIDRWRRECRTKYFVIVDSDVEFLEIDWLPRLVAALDSRSMVAYGVIPEMTYRETGYGEPFEYTLLVRPDPCVLLLDHERTHHIAASFAWREEADRWPPERAYDTAGFFALALEQEGLTWEAMSDSVRRCFKHCGGRSWRKKGPRRRRIRYRLVNGRLRAVSLLLRLLDRTKPAGWSSGTA
ncbi:MAG: glycosyltransferase [Acidimicrobiales bacterium]|jgi:hypothetical protein